MTTEISNTFIKHQRTGWLTWWRRAGWTASCPSCSWRGTARPRVKWTRLPPRPCGPGSWWRWSRAARSWWTASSSLRRPPSRPPPPAGSAHTEREVSKWGWGRLINTRGDQEGARGPSCVSHWGVQNTAVQPQNALPHGLSSVTDTAVFSLGQLEDKQSAESVHNAARRTKNSGYVLKSITTISLPNHYIIFSKIGKWVIFSL